MGHRSGHLLVALAALAAVAILLGRASPARAQEDALHAAKVHYEAGEQHYLRGRYEEAIREFEEALRLSKRPALLYNIAQAYERLGDLAKTREYLQRYLDSGAATPEEATTLGDKIRVLDERLTRTGQSPGPTTPATATAPPSTGTSLDAPPPATPAPPRGPYATWKWVAIGSGAGLVALSGFFAWDASRAESDIEGAQDPTRPWDLQGDWERGERDVTLAWITGGVGVAALAAGGAMMWLDHRATRERDVTVVPAVGAHAGGATFFWKW